jgi:hypothetical protein
MAFIVEFSAGCAIAMDTSTNLWIDAAAPRPEPFIARFIDDGHCVSRKENGVHYEYCPGKWRAYLEARGLDELSAPSGGRAYRWFWDGETSDGFVQLIVNPNGTGIMRTSLDHKENSVAPNAVVRFEATLEKTGFATSAWGGSDIGFDACQSDVFEAVINGRYRFVRGGCGMPNEIYNATRPIEALAGFSPGGDHCFFLPPDCLAGRPSSAGNKK